MEIIRKTKRPKGVVGVIAAVEGFGKTTTIGNLDGLYMLDVDDGSYGLDCPIVKFDGTVSGLMGLIAEIKSGKAPADMRNFGIDTADMLSQMLTKDFCVRKKWSSMEVLDYGKCWGAFKPEWEAVLDGLKEVARERGINVLFTLHISGDKTFTEKTTGKQWNRWAARLTPKCAEKLFSFSDFYFSGLYDTHTMQTNAGRSKIDVAISEERTIYTEHSSDHDGKCRKFITLPDGKKMPKSMSLDELQKLLPGILEASTDKNAKPGDFVEPQNEEMPKPNEERKNEDPESESPKSEPKKEEPNKEEPKSDLPEAVKNLTKLIEQFGVNTDKLTDYAASKLNDRYGIDFKKTPMKEWPDEAVLWLTRGMDKIAPKIK